MPMAAYTGPFIDTHHHICCAIYGSNFPLEKLHASYADFFGVYRKVLSEYTGTEQRAVLYDNAARFYRL